jgi:phosphate transport system protein
MQDIHKELVEMGALMDRALESAMDALIDGSSKKVEKTKKYEYSIDSKQRQIESLCMHVLLTQQPVAGDLRLVSAALKMIVDMERIGDQAEDISEIALGMNREFSFDKDSLKKMFAAAAAMVSDSVASFVQADETLARSVIARDDVVDTCFKEIRNALVERIKSAPEVAAQAMDLLMVIKYLERVGDHACNIAEAVIYSIVGEYKPVRLTS